MSNRILLLGCTGEVGSRLTKKLIDRKFKVFGIRGKKECKIDDLNHTCRSINLLDQSVNVGLDEIKPQTLIHSAWITESPFFWDSSLNLEWLEISKKVILDFEKSGGRNLIITSTSAEYDWNSTQPMKESDDLNPQSLYGKCKLDLLIWLQSRNLSLIWTRTFQQFGLREANSRFIPTLIDNLIKSEKFLVLRPRDIRDFVYIEDVVNILELLFLNDNSGIFNIGTGTGISTETVAKTITQLMGIDGLVDYKPQSSLGTVVISDSSKLLETIGKFTWTEFESALIKTIEARIK